MKVILVAIGSLGDFQPVLGVGVTLKARGHHVEMLASGAFEGMVRKAGLPFHALGSAGEHEAEMGKLDPFGRLAQRTPPYEYLYLGSMRTVYKFLAEKADPSDTIIVSSFYSVGARLANERLGLPMVSLILSPGVLFSSVRPPRFAPRAPPAWLPRWFYQGIYRLAEKQIDKVVGTGVNRFRVELGLSPIQGVRRWLLSPDRLIGLFPEWFGPRQPDWSANVELTGFPIFDDGQLGTQALPEELHDFLATRPAPIVFTPGTPIRQAKTFFEAAIAAAARLGARAVLLTPSRDQIPENLPPNIRHFTYLPFSTILPRAMAFVHHGGIGSVAQAFRAGVPQLVVPWGLDLFDNAARVEELGAGFKLQMQTLTAAQLTSKLSELLGSPGVRQKCAKVSHWLQQSDPLAETCRLIESIGREHGLPS